MRQVSSGDRPGRGQRDLELALNMDIHALAGGRGPQSGQLIFPRSSREDCLWVRQPGRREDDLGVSHLARHHVEPGPEMRRPPSRSAGELQPGGLRGTGRNRGDGRIQRLRSDARSVHVTGPSLQCLAPHCSRDLPRYPDGNLPGLTWTECELMRSHDHCVGTRRRPCRRRRAHARTRWAPRCKVRARGQQVQRWNSPPTVRRTREDR